MAYITQTETGIANLALQFTGDSNNLLTDLWNDTTVRGRQIQACYHAVRRGELRRNVWRFAIREAAVRAIDTTTNNQRQVTFGAWASGTTYARNDLVLGSDGRVYYSKVASNLANDPSTHLFTYWGLYFGLDAATEYVTTWSATPTYATGMHAVGSDGTVYIALQPSTNQNPVSSPLYWSATTDGVEATQDGSTANYTFFAGELVFIGNKVYVSLINDNDDLPSVTTSWQLLSTTPSLATFAFVYPIGTGPAVDLSTRNLFRMPMGYLREAPLDPKQGSYRWLGAPTNPFYSDHNPESDFFTSTESGPVIVRFCADVDDPTMFDPMFVNGFSTGIALRIAMPTKQNANLRADILKLYTGFMTEARVINAIEVGSTEAPLDNYLACRY